MTGALDLPAAGRESLCRQAHGRGHSRGHGSGTNITKCGHGLAPTFCGSVVHFETKGRFLGEFYEIKSFDFPRVRWCLRRELQMLRSLKACFRKDAYLPTWTRGWNFRGVVSVGSNDKCESDPRAPVSAPPRLEAQTAGGEIPRPPPLNLILVHEMTWRISLLQPPRLLYCRSSVMRL